VRGEVVGAEVRFHLDDASNALDACHDMHQVRAEQLVGDRYGVAIVEGTPQLQLMSWFFTA
jgi:hypothetical protein